MMQKGMSRKKGLTAIARTIAESDLNPAGYRGKKKWCELPITSMRIS
jgi:hypothetical protein